MVESHLGKRSITQLRKTTSDLLYSVNKTEGSVTLIENIKQCNNTLELDQGITVEASFPLVVKWWVIKKVKTHLSNIDITAQFKFENTALKIAAVGRIISRNNIPSTVVVVTTERLEIPTIINWNNCQ